MADGYTSMGGAVFQPRYGVRPALRNFFLAGDPRQVAFQVDAVLTGADLNVLLVGESEYIQPARTSIHTFALFPTGGY